MSEADLAPCQNRKIFPLLVTYPHFLLQLEKNTKLKDIISCDTKGKIYSVVVSCVSATTDFTCFVSFTDLSFAGGLFSLILPAFPFAVLR